MLAMLDPDVLPRLTKERDFATHTPSVPNLDVVMNGYALNTHARRETETANATSPVATQTRSIAQTMPQYTAALSLTASLIEPPVQISAKNTPVKTPGAFVKHTSLVRMHRGVAVISLAPLQDTRSTVRNTSAMNLVAVMVETFSIPPHFGATTVSTRFLLKFRCLDCIANPADIRFRNCTRHTCKQPDCLFEANNDGSSSPYCQIHVCTNKACDRMAKIPGGLCIKEACRREGCAAARDATNFLHSDLCTYHQDEEDQSYILSPGAWGTPRTRSTASPFGSGRHRPRTFRPPSPEFYYQQRPRAPWQEAEANRRYESMDREFHSTPRRGPHGR
ncbi:hypothetical protein NW762_002911 [Fusarium torreyae]|uniref:Uncharacterized protein n=1 Tax=Fusarium torreyae TaxID=1237075 RepID=A0A9W8SC85_9HYPO|nr:hypothetical protein NW762_002911 [Fusarium torreyae]